MFDFKDEVSAPNPSLQYESSGQVQSDTLLIEATASAPMTGLDVYILFTISTWLPKYVHKSVYMPFCSGVKEQPKV